MFTNYSFWIFENELGNIWEYTYIFLSSIVWIQFDYATIFY